jgi:hypothetical protein
LHFSGQDNFFSYIENLDTENYPPQELNDLLAEDSDLLLINFASRIIDIKSKGSVHLQHPLLGLKSRISNKILILNTDDRTLKLVRHLLLQELFNVGDIKVKT